MTARQQYWVHLKAIASITGQLNRRMSFTEASTWLEDYEAEKTIGYPVEHAMQRAWDYMFSARGVFEKWAI